MSHYHTEIIIPPTDDVDAAIAAVMKRFDEEGDDEEGYRKHAFWDFYVIGGRWAGTKQMAKYDHAKLAEFEQWMQDEKLTVAGFRSGKAELSPASQVVKVDAKWNEMFPQPGNVMVACPMFKHSNDQYGRDGKGTIDGDICTLADAPLDMKCSRVIFAGPSYDHDAGAWTGQLEAKHMLCEDMWNGVNHMPAKWDGTLRTAIAAAQDAFSGYRDDYRAAIMPEGDWLVVTVDYHS